MKVIHLNRSSTAGGAAKAAVRIHQALLAVGIDSTMRVSKGISDTTIQVSNDKFSKAMNRLRLRLGNLPLHLVKTENPVLHSPSVLPSSWPHRINQSDADLVHLHWVCREMVSIEDIGRFKKPVVWTLHDMWAFCGAEHYTEDSRFRDGYRRNNRPDHESGFDLNRWTWNRKIRAWRRPMYIVAPSRWLAECVRQSVLMRDWPVKVIHHPMNTDLWKPIEKRTARSLVGIHQDSRLLAFGAMEGTKDPRKGFDLLLDALDHLRGQFPGLELMVFGESRPRNTPDFGFPVHYAGHLHDDLSLRVLYNAADAVVIPSRQDNLPNTGVEAAACGTPVIAFDVGGLPDIVIHKESGWLARAFESEDLARGIQWVLNDDERLALLGINARIHAEQSFATPIVANQYKYLYESI